MNTRNRATLRQTLRNQRRLLSAREQNLAAKNLYHRVVTDKTFRKAGRIAFYFASDGEIDPLALLFKALAMGKQCYLPVLSKHKPSQVSFAPFRAGQALTPNRWGILEPDQSPDHFISPRSLNLVLLPLVGFDVCGNRLGMGKGYYDRTFAFKERLGRRQPQLIGLAHDCQKLANLPVNSWDVALDAVISDSAIYRPDKK